MSDILIKGVKMPRLGYREIRIHPDGRITEDNEGYEETIGTAIPVPSHGNLKDADALLKGIANDAIWKHDAMNEYDSGVRTGARTIMRLIRNAPTIIEAEEGE